MFDDLDATMKAVLDDPGAPGPLRDADVSFDTPDRDYKPVQATVNLFLHEVSENRQLRDEARVVTRVGDKYTSRLPSLRVECTYLTTAWSSQTGGLKAAEEHRLLGLALQWMSRFPVVDEKYLRGALRTPPQPYPLTAVVAQSHEGRSSAEFWSALGVAPRPSFPVIVTLTVEPFDRADDAFAVQRLHLDSTPPGPPALAGRVLDNSLASVPGAAVAVVGGAAQTTSGAGGEFVFAGLDFGEHILRVQPPGGGPAEQVPVTYAADHQRVTVVLQQ